MAHRSAVAFAAIASLCGSLAIGGPAAAAPPLPGAATGFTYSGAELLRWCGRETEFLGGVCFGMVAGLLYASQRFDICAIEGISEPQAIDIVVRYLNAHPEMRQDDAGSLIVTALQHEFPCKIN